MARNDCNEEYRGGRSLVARGGCGSFAVPSFHPGYRLTSLLTPVRSARDPNEADVRSSPAVEEGAVARSGLESILSPQLSER